MWLKCFSLTKFILYQPLKVVVHTVWAPLKPTVCILFIHILKSKNVFSRDFFLKILALCMVSIQKRVIVARVRYVFILKYFKINTCKNNLGTTLITILSPITKFHNSFHPFKKDHFSIYRFTMEDSAEVYRFE